MIHTVRTPEAYIEVKRFESGNERMICLLSADRKHLNENFTHPVSFSMTDYSFQTQIDSISGSFSISVLPDIFEDDKSLIDLSSRFMSSESLSLSGLLRKPVIMR